MRARARRAQYTACAALLALGTSSATHAQPRPHADPPVAIRGRVLVVPLAGQLPAQSGVTPQQLTRVVAEVITARGAELHVARSTGEDITAIDGCPAQSHDCYQKLTGTLGVDQVVTGRVQARRDGSIGVALWFTCSDGQRASRQLRLAPSPDAPRELRTALSAALTPTPGHPDRDPAVSFSARRVRPYAWGIAGSGVALLGAGAITLLLSRNRQSEVDDAPVATRSDFARLTALEDSGARLTTWGNALTLTGGIAVGVGAVLIWRQGRQRSAEPGVSVVAAIGADGASLAWRGAF